MVSGWNKVGNDKVLEDLRDFFPDQMRLKPSGGMANLEELRGLLLWVYFMGMPMT
jgi:hypothetical protein